MPTGRRPSRRSTFTKTGSTSWTGRCRAARPIQGSSHNRSAFLTPAENGFGTRTFTRTGYLQTRSSKETSMRARFFVVIAGLIVGATLLSAQARKTLDIWVVDVEGGNATLFVTPQGESVLIDAGNGGAAAVRDAGRIMEAVKD